MKKMQKAPLWYNPSGKEHRESVPWLAGLAADREGRALLESYCRIYRDKQCR